MNNIEKELKNTSPEPLSSQEKGEVLMSIKSDIKNLSTEGGAPKLEVNKSINMEKSLMIKIAAVVVAFTATVSTAFASNSARPGDILFGVDRALEEIQLALTTDDGREAELKLQFAEERLQEVRELIAEANSSNSSDDNSSSSTSSSSSSTSQTLEIEADVFTDITLVKVELRNGVKEIFESTATTRDEVINEVISIYSLTREEVDAVLSFEVENRASRPDDSNLGGGREDESVADAAEFALSFISGIRDDFDGENDSDNSGVIDEILSELFGDLEDLPDNARLRVEDDKIEIRDGDNRLKVEFKKDGRVKIDFKEEDSDGDSHDSDDDSDSHDSDDNDSDDDSSDSSSDDDSEDDSSNSSSDDNSSDDDSNSNSNSSSDDDGTDDQGGENEDSDSDDSEDDSSNSSSDDNSSDSSSGSSSGSGDQTDDTSDNSSIKIGAKVRDGNTEVEVEIGGEKDRFTLETTLEEEVVSHIATTYELSISVVESLIDFEG
jgi:hypothetical protein